MKNTSGAKAGVANVGFLDGLAIDKDAKYDFSIYAKALNGYAGELTIQLMVGKLFFLICIMAYECVIS